MLVVAYPDRLKYMLECVMFGRKKTDKNGKPVVTRKTNMPDSVKLSDEEAAEREKWD